MEAFINEVAMVAKTYVDPYLFGVVVALGLFLVSGTAARLLTTIQDYAPTRRNS